jgi:hypothetical protein
VSDERPDEISTSTAAALLGISPRRLRQLAEEGFITLHRRGHTTIVSAVQGYLRSIKADASRAPIDTTMSRAHAAKAALTEAATARRRAVLTEKAEVQQMLDLVARTAIDRLRAVRPPGSLSPAVAHVLRTEIETTCARIEAVHKAALLVVATGDLSEIEGGVHVSP